MMGRHDHSHSGAVGRLSIGPSEGDGLVSQTLEFVRRQLPRWRDDPKRPHGDAEKSLNSSLVDFLDSRSRSLLPMARFKHESPQSARRTVDIGVHVLEDSLIGVRTYAIYEPFYVIEAKRLPAPKGKDRETEYVSGFDPKSRAATGGIQRFKLGVHGNRVVAAAIVGFIQQDSPEVWHARINEWISKLTECDAGDGCCWSKFDLLQKLLVSKEDEMANCGSTHQRTKNAAGSTISLQHLWIVMNHSQ